MTRSTALSHTPGRFRPLGLVCVALAAFALLAPYSAPAQDVKVVRIGTGPIDTTEFPFGGLVGNAISNPPGSRDCDKGGNCGVPGLIANALSTEGTWSNLQALMRGDIDIALAQSDVAYWAYAGLGDFQGQEPMTRLRVISRLYPASIHLIARKGVKIAGLKDLTGKKLAVDAQGGGTRFTVKALLAAYGVRSSSVNMQTLNITQATAALKANKIDAMMLVSGAPVLALQDFARTAEFTLVPIAGPTAEKLTQAFPFYTAGKIPANSYGQHPDIATLDVGMELVSREDFDNDFGFGIARAVWHERNKSLFEAGHARGKLMDKALSVRTGGVPIQAGAVRYYLSQGLMRLSSAAAARPPVAVNAPAPPTSGQTSGQAPPGQSTSGAPASGPR
ncbi:MAG: TAXI family TRAP transporter solute-binding subunit [Rhodospirillaceae bacterium]|nr:TAXI family TRAP transporter solute-binding subunit [Rhodospirillaceae bacterium]